MGSLDNKLYILHGWTTDTSRWKPFLESIKETGIEPVFLPIPGLSAPIDKPWTIDDYVEWLTHMLPDNKRVSILGHSNGGRIALSFALKYPERLEQIFLLDSAGIYHNDFLSRAKRGIFRTISSIGKKITSSNTARNLLYQVAQESDYKNATPVMKETMKNLISVDLTPKLSQVRNPVTIIWGKNDTVTPYTDAQVFKNELPQSSLFPIEGAMHSPQFTHAKQVIDIIKNEFK
ncbi:MAG: alpha/beta hydrolase [Candidatus Levybacteria bacterium]|nr:alpha/beta hydrolase [Candidatus Levybacteria bacterium]